MAEIARRNGSQENRVVPLSISRSGLRDELGFSTTTPKRDWHPELRRRPVCCRAKRLRSERDPQLISAQGDALQESNDGLACRS